MKKTHMGHNGLRRREVVVGLTALGALGVVPIQARAVEVTPTTLRVGKPEGTDFNFAILDAGIGAGIFKKFDLDIEPVTLAGSAKLHQAMTAGSIDIALGAGTDFAFIAKGAPEKGIAAMAGPPLNFAVIVRADSEIKTVDDLKGRTIGVSTIPSLSSWFAEQLNKHQGWSDATGVKPVSLGNFDGMQAGLLAKNVDAMIGNLGGGHRLEAVGRGRILLQFGSFIHDFLTFVIFATDDVMAKNPDGVKRFLRGWFETITFIRQNKSEMIRLTGPITGLPDGIAQKVYDEETPMLLQDGHFDPKAVAVIKSSLMELGLVTSMPANSQLFTEKFLPSRT